MKSVVIALNIILILSLPADTADYDAGMEIEELLLSRPQLTAKQIFATAALPPVLSELLATEFLARKIDFTDENKYKTKTAHYKIKDGYIEVWITSDVDRFSQRYLVRKEPVPLESTRSVTAWYLLLFEIFNSRHHETISAIQARAGNDQELINEDTYVTLLYSTERLAAIHALDFWTNSFIPSLKPELRPLAKNLAENHFEFLSRRMSDSTRSTYRTSYQDLLTAVGKSLDVLGLKDGEKWEQEGAGKRQ